MQEKSLYVVPIGRKKLDGLRGEETIADLCRRP